MGREYKISCVPLKDAALSAMLRKLPSPIKRPQMEEIYNFCVEKDGYYLVDRLVDRPTAAIALQLFVDAALSNNDNVAISEP